MLTRFNKCHRLTSAPVYVHACVASPVTKCILNAFWVHVYNTPLWCGVRQEYEAAVEAYHRREDMKSLVKLKATRRVTDGAPDLDKDPPVFKNGGSLRDYQREVRKGEWRWGALGSSVVNGSGRSGKNIRGV